MGMVVRTNTMSINAYRQLGMNNSAVSKSLEKLSSGFRINRAGDDASGLAISEKMKAQINGLEQASANAQDGISLIQTAEGATTEIHNMLNRMITLATKSANGTIQNEVDRDAIQTEVDSLKEEITRIAKSTNFNGINLLDGSLGSGRKGAPSSVSAVLGGANATVATEPANAAKFIANAITQTGDTDRSTVAITVNYTDKDGVSKSKDITFNTGANADATAVNFVTAAAEDSDLSALFDITGTTGTNVTFIAKANGTSQGQVTGLAIKTATSGSDGDTLTGTVGTGAAGTVSGSDGSKKITLGANVAVGDTITIEGRTYTMAGTADETKRQFTDYGELENLLKADGIKLNGGDLNNATTLTFELDPTAKNQGLTLQVGDTNAEFNHVTVSIDDLTAAGLKIDNLDVSNQKIAGEAIDIIKAAINQVSTNRGNLGALQNRLEYTINNLDTTNENMTAANSRIRDTDMAKEMMNYTKMNILTQAAQAMLAQANQQPQSILQLLQ